MDNNSIETIRAAFFSMQTRQDVANLLEIKERSLRFFLYKRRPENMYCTFEVPKRNGDKRKISAPNKELKEIQKKLAAALTYIYEPKVCAFGFINNRSFVDNAQRHTKRNLILNIDLEDFFGQIHFGRVRGMLMKPPYAIGEEAATTIAQIACLNGALPQGAPSSPILTNMICAPLDNNLMRLAKSLDCTYTRYADDISFSTYKKAFDSSLVYVDDSVVHIGEKLSTILKRHSFRINTNKIALRSKYTRQEVTGLTVNIFPNLRRNYIKQLRAILHHCKKDGIYAAAQEYVAKGYCKNLAIIKIIDDSAKKETVEAWFQQVLIGKILYIKQVRGHENLTYLSLAQQLNLILNDTVLDVSSLNFLENLISHNTYILEYSQGEDHVQGSGFYLADYGLFTNFHVTENDAFFKVFTHESYPKSQICIIGKSANEISSDKTIDYALYKFSPTADNASVFKLGDSTKLQVRSKVIIVGYPNHQEGNTPHIQTCHITSKKKFQGEEFYTVGGRIVHGASGGVVLNKELEVVGIIKGGISTLADDDANENQGFIPMHLVIEHLLKQDVSK